jgi:hypothetical protein
LPAVSHRLQQCAFSQPIFAEKSGPKSDAIAIGEIDFQVGKALEILKMDFLQVHLLCWAHHPSFGAASRSGEEELFRWD